MNIDKAIIEIEKIMKFRGNMPEEGDLKKILEELISSPTICPQCKSSDTGHRCCACGTEFGADDDEGPQHYDPRRG